MSQQKAAAPEPSEIAGRYEVVKKLGAGAFGTVYKAKDKILGRMVAIKTIRMEGLAAQGASVEELVDRFKREARVSAQLKHPNIVTIYDVGEADGMSYLAMEFIDGVGLERVIAQAGRLPLERAANLGVQIADALDFAHKGSVVHRDIKPANIMVEAGDRVKVTDFGIAKVTDSGEHLTMTGSLLGTPSYMSQEQARGAALDGRSDLFAVGCILYEMLAGKKAFRGDSITGLIFKIITEEPPDIRSLAEDVPEEMVRIIAKALAKAPEARYQTGRELADDLLALTRSGTSPTVRQVDVTTASSIPVASIAGSAAAAAAPVLAPAAPPTVMASPTVSGAGPTVVAATRVSPKAAPRTSPPPPAPHAPSAARPAVAHPPPRPAPSSSNTGLLVGVGVGALVLLLAVTGGGWYVFSRRTPGGETPTGTLGGSATGASGTMAAAPQATIPAGGEAGATGPAPAGDAGAGTGATPPETSGAPATAANGGAPNPATNTAAGPAAHPPAGGPARRADAGIAAAPEPRAAEPAEAGPAPAKGGGFTFLDEEEPQMDGREAGARAAEGYRSGRGSGGRGSFGTGRALQARERSPRNLGPVERPAVATLRHIMVREEMYHSKNGRYGTLAELARATGMMLDVPFSATGFQRRGYRFELTVEEDGFKVTAAPSAIGPRAFVGDDSGYIRAGGE